MVKPHAPKLGITSSLRVRDVAAETAAVLRRPTAASRTSACMWRLAHYHESPTENLINLISLIIVERALPPLVG